MTPPRQERRVHPDDERIVSLLDERIESLLAEVDKWREDRSWGYIDICTTQVRKLIEIRKLLTEPSP